MLVHLRARLCLGSQDLHPEGNGRNESGVVRRTRCTHFGAEVDGTLKIALVVLGDLEGLCRLRLQD